MSLFTIENPHSHLHVDDWDKDKELEIELAYDGGEFIHIYLSPNQVNDLVEHLTNKLKEIGEWNPKKRK